MNKMTKQYKYNSIYNKTKQIKQKSKSMKVLLKKEKKSNFLEIDQQQIKIKRKTNKMRIS